MKNSQDKRIKSLREEINTLKRKLFASERSVFDQHAKSLSDRAELLAAGVAHEFNNILGSVDGHAEWALESKKEAEAFEALRVIREACERSSKITRALQRFNQPREDKKDIVKLDKVFETLNKHFSPEQKQGILTIKFPAPSKISVWANFGQVVEILVNLIKNAVESSEESCLVVLTAQEKNKKTILIKIEDNGPGISEIYQDILFRPFFTTKGVLRAASGIEVSAPAQKNDSGSGLGLFLSRTLAEENGGNLTLQSSKPGKTVFELGLSLAK